MADEIQMTARLYASKNGAYLPSVTYTKSATMVGTDMGSQTQAIGTASFAISRALRWQKRRWIALPEAAGNAAVALVLQWTYTML